MTCIGCDVEGDFLCNSCEDKLNLIDRTMLENGLSFTNVKIYDQRPAKIWLKFYQHLESSGKNPSEILSLADQIAFLEIVQDELKENG